MMEKKRRNKHIDYLRGVAILFVVLGHTMTGTIQNAEKSLLFNCIWSVQMPLFFIISGYVTRYSAPILCIDDLKKYLKKRTLAYLLPWFSWTIIVRGLIFQQKNFLNLSYLLWNMDAGYWFLFTLWLISVIYGITSLLQNKKSTSLRIFRLIICYFIGMCVLAFIGKVTDLSFLCIKLALYYMPFYLAGCMFGQLQDKILRMCDENKISIIVAISSIVWVFMLKRYNFYDISDNIFGISIRVITSVLGCIAICGLSKGIENLRRYKFLQWFGLHSLEIYCSHYLFLNIIKINKMQLITNMGGFTGVLMNYIITLIFVTLFVKVIHNNKVLKMLLFAKK